MILRWFVELKSCDSFMWHCYLFTSSQKVMLTILEFLRSLGICWYLWYLFSLTHFLSNILYFSLSLDFSTQLMHLSNSPKICSEGGRHDDNKYKNIWKDWGWNEFYDRKRYEILEKSWEKIQILNVVSTRVKRLYPNNFKIWNKNNSKKILIAYITP